MATALVGYSNICVLGLAASVLIDMYLAPWIAGLVIPPRAKREITKHPHRNLSHDLSGCENESHNQCMRPNSYPYLEVSKHLELSLPYPSDSP